MTSPIRIIIADDHAAVRRGVRTLLETQSHLQVVGEAATGSEALEVARQAKPDIAILDYSLPGMNGRELTIALMEALPELEVLIYTRYEREETMLDALRAGACGFVLKSDTEEQLLAAVDALSIHQPYFTDAITGTLLDQLLRGSPKPTFRTLSPREREVVKLVAEGKTNKQVAQTLNISVKTVETHRATAMHKLKLHTTAELVRYAVRNNIVQS